MARFTAAAAFAALLSTASGSLVARQTAASTTPAAGADPTAISQCSVSSSTQVCKAGTTEFRVVSTPTGALPSSYTGCHKHATDLYCFYDDGEVQVRPASAPASTAASTTAAAAAVTGAPTAVSDCHLHGVTVFCMWGTSEYQVMTTPTNTAASAIPTAFTDCHAHGAETFCIAPNGDDVEIVAEGAESSDGGHDHGTEGEEPQGENCHFHAGVEHCVGAGESESESGASGARSCAKVDRDYNIPLRIGLIFVILATSAFGVYFPIFMIKWMPTKTHTAFLVLKQFGTGIIISTAFIHLYTHAQLMFGNECLGALGYEGTTSAIVMAGIFLSFLVEYIGKRVVMTKMAGNPSAASRFSPETVTVLVLECGIIFHSILIGITLVVAGDTFFLTLFVVILFHQMFEGIALGTRIAQLGQRVPVEKAASPAAVEAERTSSAPNSLSSLKAPAFSLAKKLLLAAPFALVTPIGMAIGIGVLRHFNGNDRDTILAIGTLDALSAGILVWVGVVEMWAEDWMHNDAELLRTGPVVTFLAGLGLVAGMVIMSVLGKWA
ncbi:ZIP zinc transporter [Colletotrichum sublineola]|uniref:Putative ZIP Zinc transporter n=1 Tax=Colletotrichum sublineola TaxID=1173701 RepID=A0A066X4E8_COLSU|nr:ZIP zinc transporter [Colletotrichum sublineola]KDN62554.1 putative ZIP Zinc transporter [Colletotrichum sublineola]